MSILTKAATLRSRARRLARGAALVEAAVVIPVMLVFVGTIMFSYRSYEMKLDKQMGTRAGILYYASHNCKGDLPAGTAPPLKEAADPGGDQLPGGNSTDPNRLGADSAAGMSKSWSLAKAHPPDSPVSANVVNDRKTVVLNRMISAQSEVACNEEAFPNKWTALFKFIPAFVKSGGGLGQ